MATTATDHRSAQPAARCAGPRTTRPGRPSAARGGRRRGRSGRGRPCRRTSRCSPSRAWPQHRPSPRGAATGPRRRRRADEDDEQENPAVGGRGLRQVEQRTHGQLAIQGRRDVAVVDRVGDEEEHVEDDDGVDGRPDERRGPAASGGLAARSPGLVTGRSAHGSSTGSAGSTTAHETTTRCVAARRRRSRGASSMRSTTAKRGASGARLAWSTAIACQRGSWRKDHSGPRSRRGPDASRPGQVHHAVTVDRRRRDSASGSRRPMG